MGGIGQIKIDDTIGEKSGDEHLQNLCFYRTSFVKRSAGRARESARGPTLDTV